MDRGNGQPTVDAVRTPAGQLKFYCAHCRRWHFHGAVGPALGDGDGLRAAHCAEPPPQYKSGYNLREIRGVNETELRRAAVAAHRATSEGEGR